MNLFVTFEVTHPSGTKDIGTKIIEWNELIEYETDIDDVEAYTQAETGWSFLRILAFSRLEAGSSTRLERLSLTEYTEENGS